MAVTEPLESCRSIAHEMRKKDRSEKMSEYDKIIEINNTRLTYTDDEDEIASINSASKSAESSRSEIRTANAAIQTAIDSAESVDEIRSALSEL